MPAGDCHVRPMRAADGAACAAVVELAYRAGAERAGDERTVRRFPPDFLASRFAREPEGCFVAFRASGEVVGALYSATWGSVAWLGPLAVAPAAQGQGVGRQLLDACLRHWEAQGVRLGGLDASPTNATTQYLCGAAGFRADWLSVGLRKTVADLPPPAPAAFRILAFSALALKERQARLTQARALTEAIYPGLDWSREIGQAFQLGLGESWLIEDDGQAVGVAVAHTWPRGETREGEAKLKLLALDPAHGTAAHFHGLLEVVEQYAAQRELLCVVTRACTRARSGYWALLAERRYTPFDPRARLKRGADADYEPADGYYLDEWL